MSNYYLLSPAKIKVKDAQGRDSVLSVEDLLSTLDRTDNDGFFLDQAQLDGKFIVYNDVKAIIKEARKLNTDPSFIHVIFRVELSQKARKELSDAKRKTKGEAGFTYRISSQDITCIRLATIHYHRNNAAHFEISDESFQQRVGNWLISNPSLLQKARSKLPKPKPNKTAIFNSFLLLMITFFAMGFIFSYSGVTAAATASLIKLGLLHTSGNLAMQLAMSATISLLLWTACVITLYAGNKLLKMAQTGIDRFRHKTHAAEDAELTVISPEIIAKLEGFELEYADLEDVDIYAEPDYAAANVPTFTPGAPTGYTPVPYDPIPAVTTSAPQPPKGFLSQLSRFKPW